MKEEWRDIPGYVGLYQVSATGKVRSVDRLISVGRSSKYGGAEQYSVSRVSKELKPYCVSKEGKVKFHLHKRIASGMGSGKQSDEYIYVDDLVESAFGSNS